MFFCDSLAANIALLLYTTLFIVHTTFSNNVNMRPFSNSLWRRFIWNWDRECIGISCPVQATPVCIYLYQKKLYPLPFTLLRIVWFVFLRWTDWWSCLAQIISNILWEYAFIFQFLSFSTHISLSKLWNIHFAICEARGLLLEVPFKDIFQDLCHLDEG